MRFSTFMLSYKKKHKQLKSTITFRKLPFYQKIIVIIGFLMIIIGCCFKIAKCELAFGITLLIGSILNKIIYVFLTIFLYLLKCPQSLILSALRAFFFCGKPHISRSIFLYFRYQAWLKSW